MRWQSQIPAGEVASYGMLASLLPGVTPRIAGFAMASAPKGVPWHRVINSAGKISPRPGAERQMLRLQDEGVSFTKSGKVDWNSVRWQGPSADWLDERHMDTLDLMNIMSRWP